MRVLIGVLLMYWLIDRAVIPVWRSDPSLWRHAAQMSPISVRATGNDMKYRFGQP